MPYSDDEKRFYRYLHLLTDTSLKPLRKLVKVFVAEVRCPLDDLLKNNELAWTQRKIFIKPQLKLLFPGNGKNTKVEEWDVCLLCTVIQQLWKDQRPDVDVYIGKLQTERNNIVHDSKRSLNQLEYNIKYHKVLNILRKTLEWCNDKTYEQEILTEIDNIANEPLHNETILVCKETLNGVENLQATVDQFRKESRSEYQTVQNVVSDGLKGQQIGVENLHAAVDQFRNESRSEYKTIQNVVSDVLQGQRNLYATVCKPDKPKHVETAVQYEYPPEVKEDDTKSIPHETLSDDTLKTIDENNHHLSCRNKIPERLSLLIKQTNAKRPRTKYVPTEQFRQAEEMLLTEDSVVISGNHREGKSSMAYELMFKHRKNGHCVEIRDPGDIELIDPDMVDCVLIEDIFGFDKIDHESKLEMWSLALNKLQQMVHPDTFKLIITTRETILKQCKTTFKSCCIFSNKIKISSKLLSKQEKESIFRTCLNKHKRNISPDITNKCCDTVRSDIGFPGMCEMFASKDEYFIENESFFETYTMLNKGISSLSLYLQFSLLYLWFKGGRCSKNVDEGVVVELREIYTQVAENLGPLKVKELGTFYQLSAKTIDPLINEILKGLKELDGELVILENGVYRFSHRTIYNSVGLYLANNGFADKVISKCSIEFLLECLGVIKETSDTVYILVLTEELRKHFVNRLIDEVTRNRHCKLLSNHPCLTTEVVDLLWKTLKRRKKFKLFLGIDQSKYKEDSFLEHFVESAKGQSNTFLKLTIEKFKCGIHLTKKCKTCVMFHAMLRAACRGRNIDAVRQLDFVHIDEDILKAVEISNSEHLVEVVLDRIKCTGQPDLFDATCRRFHCHSIRYQNTGIYELTLKYGKHRTTAGLLRVAAEGGNIIFLGSFARNLNLISNWREYIENEDIKQTLHTMVSTKVFRVLSANNILPTLSNVQHYILEGRWDLVKTIVLTLKASNSACDPGWEQKTNLFERIYQDSECHTALQEKGILYVDIYLNCLYENIKQSSTEDAKEMVKTALLDFWGPQNVRVFKFAKHALLNFPEMYTFLLQNNFTPTSYILYLTVQTGNLDIVNETLSAMETIDGDDGYIERTLVRSIYSTDLYDALVQKGAKPTVYHCVLLAKHQTETCVHSAKIVLKALANIGITDSDKNALEKVFEASVGNDELFRTFATSSEVIPSKAIVSAVYTRNGSLVELLITEMKRKNQWPPESSDFEHALCGSLNDPDVMDILLASKENISTYTVLSLARKDDIANVKLTVETLKNELSDMHNDIILKIALLETRVGSDIEEYLREEGINDKCIFQDALSSVNREVQVHISSLLRFNKATGARINALGHIRPFCKVKGPCTVDTLIKAIQTGNNQMVKQIVQTLKDMEMFRPSEDECLTTILSHAVSKATMYVYLLDEGIRPTMKILCSLIQQDIDEPIIKRTKCCLLDNGEYSESAKCIDDAFDQAISSPCDSIYEHEKGYMKRLCQFGFKPKAIHLMTAVKTQDVDLVKYVFSCLNHVSWGEQATLVHEVMEETLTCERNFQIYQYLSKQGFTPSSKCILMAVDLGSQEILQKVSDDFITKPSPEDAYHYLEMAKDLGKSNKEMMKVLNFLEKAFVSFEIRTAIECQSPDVYSLLQSNTHLLNNAFVKSIVLDISNPWTHLEYEEPLRDYAYKSDILRDIMKFERETKLIGHESMLLLSTIFKDFATFQTVLAEMKIKKLWAPDKMIATKALEESIVRKEIQFYKVLIQEQVAPTGYCLYHAVHCYCTGDAEFLWLTIPYYRKIPKCLSYCDAALALCIQHSNKKLFDYLIYHEAKPTPEHLYESVISNNYDFIKDILPFVMNYKANNYWISSVLVLDECPNSIKEAFGDTKDCSEAIHCMPYRPINYPYEEDCLDYLPLDLPYEEDSYECLASEHLYDDCISSKV